MSVRHSHFMRVTKKGAKVLPPYENNPKLQVIAQYFNFKMKQDLEIIDEIRISFMESRAPCGWCQKMEEAGLNICLYCHRPFDITQIQEEAKEQ